MKTQNIYGPDRRCIVRINYRDSLSGSSGSSVYNDTTVRDWDRYVSVVYNGGPSDFKRPTRHSWSLQFLEYLVCSASGSYAIGSTSYSYSGFMPIDSHTPVVGDELQTRVQSECTHRFYDLLRNSDLALLVDASQSRQTIHMVAKAFSAFTRWKSEVPKALRKISSFKHSTKSAADLWLEYVYGWVPLMKTVYDVAEYHRTTWDKTRIKAKATCVRNDRILGSYGLTDQTALVRRSYRYLISRQIRVTNPNMFELSRLTPLNPLAIIWENIPFSFVFDWFCDIGQYMQDLETSFGIGWTCDPGFGFDTSSYKIDVESIAIPRPNLTAGQVRLNGKCRRRYTGMSRTPTDTAPLVKLPGLKLDLGARRLVNAAALARQVFSPQLGRILR